MKKTKNNKKKKKKKKKKKSSSRPSKHPSYMYLRHLQGASEFNSPDPTWAFLCMNYCTCMHDSTAFEQYYNTIWS